MSFGVRRSAFVVCLRLPLAVVVVSGFSRTVAAQAAADGAKVYADNCASCHDQPTGRTPPKDALKERTADAIHLSLTSGTMAMQALSLTVAEKKAVSEYLSGKTLGNASAQDAGALHRKAGAARQHRRASRSGTAGAPTPANSRYQPKPGLTAADVPNLKLKWAFGFPGGTQAYGNPSIVAGRVFVGSDNGTVYALDADTGCTYWSFKADGGVRSAPSVGRAGNRDVVYFGDLKANVFALDAATGAADLEEAGRHARLRARHRRADAGRRQALRAGVVGRGSAGGAADLRVLHLPRQRRRARRGDRQADLEELHGPGSAAAARQELEGDDAVGAGGRGGLERADDRHAQGRALRRHRQLVHRAGGEDQRRGHRDGSEDRQDPLVEPGDPEDAFVVGCRPGNENCPKELGPDFDFGNSPILRALPGGKRILVIGQKSGIVWGLDPDNEGKVVWQFRAGKGGALGGIEWGSAADEQAAYIPVSDVLAAPNEAGGLFALKLATGEKIWNTPAPKLECNSGRGCTGAQSAPVSVIPGVVFSGSVDGHMRAYSTVDGSIIWDFNTAREFETVNRVPAKGGSIDAAGPVVADGLVLTNSGYALWKGLPGNVLLAFSAK